MRVPLYAKEHSSSVHWPAHGGIAYDEQALPPRGQRGASTVPFDKPVLALAAFCIIFLIALALHLVILQRLRTWHRLQWERLGRPSLGSIGPLPGNFNLFTYNWS